MQLLSGQFEFVMVKNMNCCSFLYWLLNIVFLSFRGLSVVLQTGNMTLYPNTCSKATASFSVLSETIKWIQEVMIEQHQRNDLAKLITRLQSFEKDKLHLTAACHLERIRRRNHEIDQLADPRISKLLEEGVVSLQQKIALCIESVNEVLDEIRITLLEEQES